VRQNLINPSNVCDLSSYGMVKTLTLIYQENGVVKGLYRGMSINYLRAIPMVAVSFSTYELMKQMLNLDTGMKL
jgi:solute carrier family 25 (mitochondrial carrier protein), member 16